MAGVSSSLRQQATAVVNQQLLSLFRWQKLCQLLLSISQVSLISQHLILHVSVEQSPCKNKSFVAKELLGCTIAIYFPIQNATSFPEMKNVMWPAAGADKVQDCAKERKRRVTTNFCFVLLFCGCLDSGQWVRSSAPALTWCFIGAQPGIRVRAGPWEPSRSQTGHICHLSTQNETWLISVTSLWQHRATKMTDVTPTITGQFFKGCKHRARQKTPSCVCVNEAITPGGCTFQSAPLAELHSPSRCAWLCIQARRAGRTWWPRLLPEASPSWPTSFAGALLHPAQLFPLWTTQDPRPGCSGGRE